ncbi:MAG: tetratricopeptide repeat protein [Chloroflexi bacterium]|nr:tetratricopeptide repeat protein [Chloroflexota bacterium]
MKAEPRLTSRAVGENPLEDAAARNGIASRAAGVDASSARGDEPRHNLPHAPTSFVGRRRELDEVRRLLMLARLVTLTGPGGCGKTRLALEAAAGLFRSFPDGIWQVELAELAEPALVPGAVAVAVGASPAPVQQARQTAVDDVVDRVGARQLLLVLDNCEHVIEACAGLAQTLLRACPQVRIVATSRQALGIEGEAVCHVPSLAVPEPARAGYVVHHPKWSNTSMASRSRQVGLDVAALAQHEAIQLFVERARLVRPAFALTAENAPAVLEICRRLDGLPLALELAAARAGELGIAEIAVRLNGHFALLRAGSDGAQRRPRCHHTLSAAMGWSYASLDPQERAVFQRLAVFAGGWTLEAAEAVCGEDQRRIARRTNRGGTGIRRSSFVVRRDEVLEVLSGLVRKSLVVAEAGPDGTMRYRLLETLREYGRGLLAWCYECGEPQLALRLANALARFWDRHTMTHSEETERWTSLCLWWQDASSAGVQAATLASAAHDAAGRGDYTRAVALYEEAVPLRRQLGDVMGYGQLLNRLASIACLRGEYVRARLAYEEVLAQSYALCNNRGIGFALGNLGHVAHCEGDFERAAALHAESLAMLRAGNDTDGRIAWSLANQGRAARHLGDHARAAALFAESLALYEGEGGVRGAAKVRYDQARLALCWGDVAQALALATKSLLTFARLSLNPEIAACLEVIAEAATRGGDAARAARLLGAAAALRQQLGTPLHPCDRADHEVVVTHARAVVGQAAFATTWARGRDMVLDDAVDYALAMPEPVGMPAMAV